MISETSGRSAYLRYLGFDQPITGWSFASSSNRNIYRASDSDGFPTRKPGTIKETLIVTGVGQSDFVTNRALKEFEIGWYDYLTGTSKYISFTGYPLQSQYNFNYTNSTLPALTWAITYEGIWTQKILKDNQSFEANDEPFCTQAGCELEIWTSDFTLNLGLVQHVTTANIIYTFQRPVYYSSAYPNHADSSGTVFDVMIDFNLEGDFDYWLEAVQTNASRRNYRFFYSGTSSIDVDKMVVTSMDNFIANVVTGQLISAHVQLGASYGS